MESPAARLVFRGTLAGAGGSLFPLSEPYLTFSQDLKQPAPPPMKPAPEPSRTSVRPKLAGMLYRPQSMVMPHRKERAAGQIPLRMNQFEDA